MADGTADLSKPDTWMNFINGEMVEPSTGTYFDTYSPVDGALRGHVAMSAEADVDAAVRSAATAQPAWRDMKPIERGRILMRMSTYIRDNMDMFVAIEQRETGKPHWQVPFEIGLAADYLELYAGLCNLDHGQIIDIGPGHHAYALREPYGVIGAITPWNSPLSQYSRCVATALTVGNTIVSKPSEFTSGTAVTLAQAAVEHCGLPRGVANVVLGAGPGAGAALVAHPLVRKVAFTGSQRAGREISKAAGSRLIPVTMELGGKSPNIVFEDCDMDAAVAGSVQAFAFNSGQVCFAGTRCLVHESIHDAFVEKLAEAASKVTNGPEKDARLGAMTTEAQYQKVMESIAMGASEGAELVCGGLDAKQDSWGKGWYVPVTIFKGVSNDMQIAREEIFGPILCVLPFKDEEEALAIANDTEYGLAACVWTQDMARAHRMIRRLEAGNVMINEYSLLDVELPFGGYKGSGHGREKGLEALHYYSQLKTVRMKI